MKWWKQKEEVFKTSLFRLPLGVTRGRAGYCVGFMPFTRIYDRKKNSISYLFLIFFWKLKLKKFESKQLLPKFYNYCHFSLVFEPFNGKYLGQQCKIIKKKRIDKQNSEITLAKIFTVGTLFTIYANSTWIENDRFQIRKINE